MKYYINIALKPNADIALNFLWEKVFKQIHLGLVEIQNKNSVVPIGVSFPGYMSKGYPLGLDLRLFAVDKETLEKLNINIWLKRLSDYVHISEITEVPVGISSYACFKRHQVHTNRDRLARRRVRRHNISLEQARKDLENFEEKRISTPYINMTSQSTGDRFRIHIQRSLHDDPISGGFTSYGLSNLSTVPNF